MLGIQPWALFLIFIIIVLVASIFISRRNAAKKIAKYDGKFIGLFITNTGVKFYICKEEQGEVDLPEEYSKIDKSTITGFTWAKNTETKEDEKYFIQSQHRMPVLWPPEKKMKDRIKMDMVIYKQGIPLPIVGLMCELWTSEMLSTMATSLIGLSSDKDELRAMNAQDSMFWNNIEYLRKQIQKLGTTQIASFVAAGAAAIGLLLVWQLSGKLDAVLKAWGS